MLVVSALLAALQCTGSATLGLSAATVAAGKSFDITITAPEWDADSAQVGALRAVLTSDKPNEPAHDANLIETSAASGIFVGTVSTVLSTAAALPLPGLINVVPGTRVHVAYPHSALAATIRVLFPGVIALPAYSAIGEDLLLRLQDPDMNLDSTVKDTISATVAVSCQQETQRLDCPLEPHARPAQEVELVRLVETTPDSGLFTAIVKTYLQLGSSAPHAIAGDQAIDLRGASTTCGADEITITYSDMAPAANLTAVSRASFRASILFSQDRIAAEVNCTVNVTVRDGDLLERSSVTVTVSSSKVDEPPETIILKSIGVCQGTPTFIGSFVTYAPRGAPVDGDGALQVRQGDILTVNFLDEAPDAVVSEHIRVLTVGTITLSPARADKSPLFGDTTIATIELGSELSVTVKDEDGDLKPYHADSIPGILVTVSDNSSRSEITLLETGLSTGIFTGVQPVKNSSQCVTASCRASTLIASKGALIRVLYFDDGVTVRQALARVASDGLISIRTGTLTPAPGDTLSITVVDSDLDQLNSTIENVSVFVSTDTTKDTKILNLVEMSASSAYFTGVLATSITPQENKLLVSASAAAVGTVIEAAYSDTVPLASAMARLRLCSTATLSLSPIAFQPGAPLSVTLVDADLQGNPHEIERVSVNVIATTEADRLTLVETGWATSTFTGVLATSASSTGLGDNVITVRPCCTTRDTVNVSYSEDCPSGTRLSSTSRSASPGTLQARGPVTASPQLIKPGNNITITVTDQYLNSDNAVQDQYSGLVNVSAANQTIAVAIAEDSVSSGIFTGRVETSATRQTGKLFLPEISGIEKSPILVTFTDVIEALSPSIVVLETQRKGSITLVQEDVDTGRISIGRSALVVVYDKDLDYLSSATGITVRLNASGTTDSVTIHLAEDGLGQGRYTGTFQTSAGAGSAIDNTLNNVRVGGTVSALYTDTDGSTSTATFLAGTEGNFNISNPNGGLINSATPFIDVILTDPDLNTNAASRETYIYNGQTGVVNLQRETLMYVLELREESVNSARFICRINFDQPVNSGMPSCVGVINGTCAIRRLIPTGEFDTSLRWDRVRLEYTDPNTPAGGQVRGQEGSRVKVFLAPGQDGKLRFATHHLRSPKPPALVAGALLEVTVIDQDMSKDRYTPETCTVQVRNNGATRSTEMVQTMTLTETDLQSDIFTGALRTYLDLTPNTNVAGVMNVAEGESLFVTYMDVNQRDASVVTPISAQIFVAGWYTCRGGVLTGEICSGPSDFISCGTGYCGSSKSLLEVGSLKVGSCAPVTLRDPDSNKNNNAIESVVIEVENLLRNDKEAFTLIERSADSEVFVGCIQTKAVAHDGIGTPSDGLVAVFAGDDVSVRYDETIPVLAISRTLIAVGSTVAQLSVSPQKLKLGDILYITVVDADINMRSGHMDHALVTVRTNQGSFALNLTENGITTGVFTGAVSTSSSQPSILAGLSPGDMLIVSHVDELPERRTRTISAVVGHVAQLSMSEVRLEGTSTITVKDLDAPDTHEVEASLSVLTPGGQILHKKTVRLHRSSVHSDFVGAYSITSDTSTAGADTRTHPILLGVDLTTRIRLQYLDNSPLMNVSFDIHVLSSTSGKLYCPQDIKSGTPLLITLIDLDLNLDSSTIEESFVNISSSNVQQSEEKITLLETSPSSGTFTARVPLRQGAAHASSNDLALDSRPGDILAVTYEEAAPQRSVVELVQVVTSYAAVLTLSSPVLKKGEILYITVDDADLNTKESSSDVTSVHISTKNFGVIIALKETDVSSARFTASFHTGGGVLPLSDSAELTVTYNDVAPLTELVSQAELIASSVGTIDIGPSAGEFLYDARAGIQMRTVAAGDGIVVTVVDADLNNNVQVQESSVITFYTSQNDQLSEVSIYEVGINSNTFTGMLITRLAESPLRGYVDIMDVLYGDRISAYYNDKAPSAAIRPGAVVRIATPAVVEINPTSATAGTDFTITLHDQDLDQNSTVKEEVSVKVFSAKIIGSVYSIRLTETTDSSGVFTASIRSQERVTTALPRYGIINVEDDDELIVEYTDLSPVIVTATATARVERQSCGCATVSTEFVTFGAGEDVIVQVYDPDQNKQKSAPETLLVQITNLNRPQQIYTKMKLRETAADTSIFTGTLRTRNTKIQPNTFAGNSDEINVDTGDDLEVRYSSISPSGSLDKTTVMYVQDLAEITVTPRPLLAGGTATITVQDDDMDTGPSIDTTIAKVTSSRAQEPIKEITLTETGARSGTFTGVFHALQESQISLLSDTGVVHVDRGDILTVLYDEDLPRVRRLEFREPIAQVATIAIGPVPFRESSLFTVEVQDIDANLDHLQIESVTVDVSTDAHGILRAMQLQETELNSGVFTASIATSPSSIDGSQKLAPTRAKEMLSVSYRDLAPVGLIEMSQEILESARSLLTSPILLKAGARLPITVTDPDLNGKVPETIEVTASAYRPVLTPGVPPGTYSKEGNCTVTLRKETPYATSFFGFLETGISANAPNCLHVIAADKIEIIYFEPSPLANIMHEVSVMTSHAGLIRVSQNKLTTEGSVEITVTDLDLDTQGDKSESLLVNVHTSVSALSSITLTLAETSVSSGEFTGKIHTKPWTACSLDAWGCTQYSTVATSGEHILYVEPGQIVSFHYLDAAPYANRQVIIPVCTTAKLEVHPLVIAIGWNVTIYINDPDRAGTSAAQVTAIVDNGRYLNILVSEYAPGKFRGTAETSFLSVNKNGTIQLTQDDKIHFIFSDDCPGHSVSTQVNAVTIGTLKLVPNPVQVGEKMSILVNDLQNAKQTRSSTVTIICAGSLGDEQTVQLTETPSGSGIYSGSIVPGLAGEISAMPDMPISCRYPLQTPPTLLIQNAGVRRSFDGVLSATPDIVNTGGVLTISVNDKDLNADATTIESHSLRIVATTPMDSKMLTLTETSADSFIFTGMIIVAENLQVGQAIDTLLGSDKQFITATYSDNAPLGTTTIQVPVSASNVGVLRIKPEIIRLGSELQILVADMDLNRNPSVVESASVTVSVLSPGSNNGIIDVQGRRFQMTAVVHVKEMTPNAQFFTGKLITISVPDAQAKPNTQEFENVIYVMEDYLVTLVYQDAAPLSSLVVSAFVLPSQKGQMSFSPNPPTIGEALTVTVVDFDLEYDPARDILPGVSYSSGPGNCDVFGSNPGCRDVGVLPIVPTTPGGTTFTGTLYLFDGIATGNAGLCYLTCYDVSSAEGATVEFSYADAAPKETFGGYVKVATSAQLTVQRIGLEGVIDITVYDQDLNQNVTHAEEGHVFVERDPSFAINRVRVNLTETEGNTGFFTGMLPTTQSAVATTGILPAVTIGQSITVKYYDLSPEMVWKTYTKTVVSSNLAQLYINSTGEQIRNIFMKPAKLTYYLQDDDLNVDPVRTDTANILITSSDPLQGSEAVTLMENGFNTGMFTADLRFTVGTFNRIPNNMAMDVSDGDFITAVYQDKYPYRTVSNIAKVASIGRLIVNPAPVTANRNINITVIDADLNVNKHSIDRGSVLIFNKEYFDNETVVLTEISQDSSIFTGVTASSTAQGRLPNLLSGLYEGGAVHAVYLDAIPQYIQNNCAQCLVTNKVAMTANISISPSLLPVAGSLTVTVTDTDLNLDTTRTETGRVEVEQYFREPYDMRMLTIIETGPNTNIFTGVLSSSPTFIDGLYGTSAEMLYGPQGARIRAKYLDHDPFPSTIRSATTRISMIGSITMGPSPVNPNGMITVTVRDDDLDATMNVDTQTEGLVTVNSPNDIWNSGGISVLLRETGESTGFFTGTRETNERQSNSAGVIVSGAVQGSYVTATYTDPIPYGIRVARVRVSTFANLTVSPPRLYEGTSITVTVTDADLNDDPSRVELHTVAVSQQSDAPDALNLTIIEMSNSSNYFTGVLPTNLNGGTGILRAPEGSLILVKYLDKNPTPARVLTVNLRVSIQGELTVNTATIGQQGVLGSGQVRFKPTTLDTSGNPMTSCFVVPGDMTCSGTCLCRSFPKIFITVIDQDVESPAQPTVIVYNMKGVEYETVTMQSTGTTATFSGELTVSDNSLEGTSDSRSLNMVPGDILQVGYIDVAPPRNVLVNYRVPYVGRAIFIPRVGMDWDASPPVMVGVDSLNLRLTDVDLIGLASATVLVSCNVGTDEEQVTMTVTNIPSVFTGTLPTESNYRGVRKQDGKVQVHRQDTVRITYVDSFPTSTQGMQLAAKYFTFRAELFSHQQVILPDGDVHITLVDCDLGRLVTSSTQSYVELSTAEGDALTVALTETSTVCGEYTGIARTSTRQKFDTTKIDGATPGSKISVKYLDCSDNSRQTFVYNVAKQGVVSFASAVHSTAAGLPITVYLNDTDQDTSTDADKATVIVRKEGSRVDVEVMNLIETGGKSGVFTAVLNTSFDDTNGSYNQSNGILNSCNKGDTITATYRHATLGATVSASVTFLSEAGAVNIQNRSRAFSPYESITITVRDADLNADVYEAEIYNSSVSVNVGGDTEFVSIKETARNSRVFTGMVQTSTSAGRSHDGTLNTIFNASGGSIAEFVYNDTALHGEYPRLCRTSGVPHGCHIQYRHAHNVGELTLSQSVYAEIGQPISVTVMDGDLNMDFTAVETTVVQISKAGGGATISMPLTESGMNTGIFTGSIATADVGSDSPSQLRVTRSQALTFSYQDAHPVNSTSVTILPRYLGSLLQTFNVLLAGGALRISLTDIDLNLNDSVAETVPSIYVTNLMTHQREQVTLTEAGFTSGTAGTFTGVLSTLADKSRGVDFSGKMMVQAGDLLNVIYADTGPRVDITRDVRIATRGEVTKTPLLVAVDAPMMVTVSDMDMDRNVQAADTIPHLLKITKDHVMKTIALTETGLSTGLFTGEVTLTKSMSSLSTFGPVSAWESITVTYSDQMPLDEIEKILPVFAQGQVTVSPWPWIDAAIERLSITISDMDMNRDALIAETIAKASDQAYVSLYLDKTKQTVLDREFLQLTETGMNSGVFTGDIDVDPTGVAVAGNGILAPASMMGGTGVGQGYILEASYFDVAPNNRAIRDAYPSNAGFLSLTPCLPGESPCKAVVGAGVMLTITVTDRDLNRDDSAHEQVTVTVNTDREREPVETIFLTECRVDPTSQTCQPHPNSNLFVGHIQTARSSSWSQQGDGVLNVLPGDCDKSCTSCAASACKGFIAVEYRDVSPAASVKKYAKVGHLGKIDMCGQLPGQAPLDYCLFDLSSSVITVTVTDPDLNEQPGAADIYAQDPSTPTGMRVSVRAQFSKSTDRSLVKSDFLYVGLRETGVSTNVFTGTFSHSAGADTPGSLQFFDANTQSLLKTASSIVTATYEDATSDYPKAYARFRTDSQLTMSTSACAAPCNIAVGDRLTVTVLDGDMDQDRLKAETLEVQIKSKSSTSPTGLHDQQTLVLVETGPSTGKFVGSVNTLSISTRASVPQAELSCDDTVLHVYEEADVKFTAIYDELAPLAPNNLQTNAALTATWPAKITITPNVTYVGATVTVTVQDFDLVGTGVDPIVQMSSDYVLPAQAATAEIVLQVTQNADIFTGTYLVDSSRWGTPSGTQRRVLTASYTDVSHGNAVRSYSAQMAAKGVITLSPFADTISSVFITLQDSSLDTSDQIQTLTSGVTVSTDVGGSNANGDYADTEKVALTETGPSTSTFTGVLPIVRAATKNPNDGVLQGDLGRLSASTGLTLPTISVTYEDSLPPETVSLAGGQKIECKGNVIVPRTFEPMKPFTVTVSDCDLAASNAGNTPSYLPTIPVILRTNYGKITRNITLVPQLPFESFNYEAKYVGTVTTNYSSVADTDVAGVVASQDVGSTVDVIYMDSAPRGERRGQIVADILGELNINATFNSRTSHNVKYKVDKNSFVSVRDRDANINANQVDSVTVVAKTATDEEVITLLEVGLNENMFTGWLPADAVGANVRGDRLISPVGSHIPITVKYLDPSPGGNVTVTVLGSDFDSVELLSPVHPVNGAPIRVTVVDSDLDTNINSPQSEANLLSLSRCSARRDINCENSSAVPLGAGDSCETRAMILNEKSLSSAIFTGELRALTCMNEQNSRASKFYVVCEGLQICDVTATYVDETWGSFTSTARTSRQGLLGTSFLTSSAGANTFVAGEALYITIRDADLNANESLPDSTSVSLNNSFSPLEVLSLTETGNSTGIFTGVVSTIAQGTQTMRYVGIETPQARFPLEVLTPSVPISSFAKLVVNPGQTLVISYHDASPSGHIATKTIAPRPRATIQSSPFPLLPSGIMNIMVTVVDSDASAVDASVTTLTVNVSVYANASSSLADHETMLLNETGSSTGIFTGSMRTDGEMSLLSNALLNNINKDNYKYKITYFQNGTGGVDGTKPPAVYRKEARDASLTANSTLRAGAAIYLTVTDDDQDLDWDLIDTVIVEVTSDKRHEGSESLTLLETSVSSGIFTGILVTMQSSVAGGQNDAVLNVVEGNILRVAYVEPFNVNGIAALSTKIISVTNGGHRGQVMFVDPLQGYSKAMLINEPASMSGLISRASPANTTSDIQHPVTTLYVLILDLDPRSTVYGTQVTVSTPLQSRLYSINENTTSDIGQGRYVIQIFISKEIGSGSVLGGFTKGSLVTVSYHDVLPHETISTQGVVNEKAIITATPQPIGMGDTLTITVTDGDLNEDHASANVGTVLVQSSRTGEGPESVPITETGISTNVFTGLLRTALRTLLGAKNSGDMNVAEAEVLTLSYEERARGSTITDATKLMSIKIHVGLPGLLEASEVVKPGQFIVITVRDSDLNLTPENMEYANVTVATSKDHETEVVKLSQTGPRTGIFTGALRTCTRCSGALCPDLCIAPPCTCVESTTCFNAAGEPLPMNCPSEVEGPSNDGVLYVEQGNLITIKYFERMPEMTHAVYTHVPRLGSLTTVPPTYMVPGSDVSVILLDSDGNRDPTAVEFVDVDFETEKFEESTERVRMFEDDRNSGRFTGLLRTMVSDPANPRNSGRNDGIMAVDPGDTIKVKYQDEQTFVGGSTYIISTLTAASAGTLTACSVNGSSACLHWSYIDQGVKYYMGLPGETFSIKVTDIDLALKTDVANVSAYVFPTGTADFETLSLDLKGDSVFSASMKSEIGNSGTPGDGILTVTADSEITFTYVDEVPRVTKKAIVRMAMQGVLQLGPRLYNRFPTLAVNLTDRDLNTKNTVREVVIVDVVNSRFPNQIARVGMLESEPSSGFFQGSITLTYASTTETVNDGTLRGLSGDQVTVSYADSIPQALVKSQVPLRFAGGMWVSNNNVAGNELFTVTLSDGDLDLDRSKADTLLAILSLSSDVQGNVPISMTETGVENGIFTASILPRLSGTGIVIDDIDPFGLAFQVQVEKGKDVRLTYIDVDNGIPVTESVKVYTRAKISTSVAFSAGVGVLQVMMTDADLMGSGTAPAAVIYTSDPKQAEESVPLVATGIGSAVFTGNILAQAHTGTTKAGIISLRDTDTIFAKYQDTQPVATIVTETSSPRPRFIEPTPPNGRKFTTAVDCAFQIGLRGTDRSLETKRLVGAAVLITPTRYRDKDGTYKIGLAPGVSLSPAEPGIFSQATYETSMSWTPRKEQEGGVYVMCFAVEESHGLVSSTGAESNERCYEITVARCQKCALPGEDLNRLALSLGSEWLTMWSFNHHINRPEAMLDGALVKTALAYRVVTGDSMATISMRFGTTVRFLLALNPDLTASGDLRTGETICILPNQVALDGCPAQPRSTTWEKLEEQYIPVDYYDNPFNWEDIQWTDLGGKPVKTQNPDYPQLPARKVQRVPGYSLAQDVVV
jgi:hypothetical protein